MKITRSQLKQLIKEEISKVLSENVASFTKRQGDYIAIAAEPAEVPLDQGDPRDIEHPSLLSWETDPGEYDDDRYPDDDPWARAAHYNMNDSWYVAELKEPPRKFPEAALGWYVVEHPFGRRPRAVAGAFGSWEDAAAAADEISGVSRKHSYR